jgi:hypothetical protein
MPTARTIQEVIESVCKMAVEYHRRGDASPMELLIESKYHTFRASITVQGIQQYLLAHSDLVASWYIYSENKRADGCSFDYHNRRIYYSPGNRQEQKREETFDDINQACAAYIKHEMDSIADQIDRLGGEGRARQHIAQTNSKLNDILNNAYKRQAR